MLGVVILGLRHGFDPDHVAALTDIAGSQLSRFRSLVYSAAYVLGHAAIVIVLGVAIAAAGVEVPEAARLIGASLVAMGTYVVWQAARGRTARSRAHLLHTALQGLRNRLRPRVDIQHDHEHVHHPERGEGTHGHRHANIREAELVPAGENGGRVLIRHRHHHAHVGLMAPYRVWTVLAVGVVHGIGAETPTQVLALSAGVWALGPFVIGLLVGNTIVSLVATGLLTRGRLRLVNLAVGTFSVAVGVPYVLGTHPLLAW